MDIKLRVWLMEYKLMLEREARSSNVPMIAKRKMEKVNEIKKYLDSRFL